MNQVSVGIIFLIVVQAIHLFEEVRQDFRRKVPIGEIPKSLFVWLNVAAFTFAIVTLCLCQAEMAIGFVLAWIYGIAMIINGCIHMGMMIHKRGYFPGGVTAPLVLAAAGNLICWLAYR
jgi:hypothetical protein